MNPLDHPTTIDPSAAPSERSATARLRSFLRLGFVVTLLVFLAGGFVLVGAQAVQLVAGDGPAVAAIGERLGPPTFTAATVCGLFAFALEYLRPASARDEDA